MNHLHKTIVLDIRHLVNRIAGLLRLWMCWPGVRESNPHYGLRRPLSCPLNERRLNDQLKKLDRICGYTTAQRCTQYRLLAIKYPNRSVSVIWISLLPYCSKVLLPSQLFNFQNFSENSKCSAFQFPVTNSAIIVKTVTG